MSIKWKILKAQPNEGTCTDMFTVTVRKSQFLKNNLLHLNYLYSSIDRHCNVSANHLWHKHWPAQLSIAI